MGEVVQQPNSDVTVETRRLENPLPGVSVWTNPKNGFRVLDLEFVADPKKRNPEWIAQQKRGMPIAEWEREYGKTWVVYDGKSVYVDFATAHIARGNIIAPRRAKLVSGWDGGPTDLNLAWALGLVLPHELAVTIIDEFMIDDGNVKDFVQIVGSRLQLEWFKLGGFSLHVADQSVFTPGGIERSSLADEMRKHGMSPIPGEVSFAKRRTGVDDLLTRFYTTVGNELIPRLRIHERCQMSIEGMQGGYHYPKSNAGVGGEYKPLPLKNKFSHVLNCIEYICSRLEVANYEIPYEGRRLPDMSII